MYHFWNPDYENADPCPGENGANPGPEDNQNLDKSHIHQDPFKATTRETHAPTSEDQVKESSKNF